MDVSSTPSTDALFYNRGAASIAHDIYRAHKFVEADTSMLGGLGERYFSHPFVVSHQGLRGGPVRSHLRSIVGDDGEPTASNLDLVRPATVQRIIFDSPEGNRAVGVTYVLNDAPTSTGGGDPAPVFAPLAPWGRVILAGGALMSPRLLMLSGVGPFQRHDEIFADGFSVPFHTCPLRATGPGGVDPWTPRVKGTRNIDVVDDSFHPAPLSAHPVATIMAVAEKASDILSRLL